MIHTGRLVEKVKSTNGVLWRMKTDSGDGGGSTLEWVKSDWRYFLEEGDGISFICTSQNVPTAGPASGSVVYDIPNTVEVSIPRQDEWILGTILPRIYRRNHDDVAEKLSEEASDNGMTIAEWLDCVSEKRQYFAEDDSRLLLSIFGWWFKSVLKRRVRHLFLQEPDQDKFDEIIEEQLHHWSVDWNGYYELVRSHPLKVITLNLKQAIRLCHSFRVEISEHDLMLARVARFIYNYSTEGQHSHVPEEIARREVPSINDLLDELVSDYGVLYSEKYKSYYIKRNYEWENNLAKSLVQLMKMPPIYPSGSPPIVFERDDLNPDQKKAIEMALSNRFSIITGGAGRGKTTITREICRNLDRRGESYVVTAVTGAAVERAKDVIQDDRSLTAHLLCKKSIGLVNTVIIDESSVMVTWLLSELRQRYDGMQRLIMIGDINQLRPVSWGAVFRQLFHYNQMNPKYPIPVTKLTTNHREHGKIISFDVSGRLAENDQCKLISGNEESAITLYQSLIATTSQHNISIIVPYNDVARNMNKRCQEVILNKRMNHTTSVHDTVNDVKWIQGDRVVMKRNTTESAYGVKLHNGAMGQIIDIDTRTNVLTIEFGNNNLITASFLLHSNNVPYRENKLTTRYLMHAYSFTAHYGQGNEWPIVIIFVPHRPKSPRFFNFNLIYTAISRAKNKLFIVGDIKSFHEHFKLRNVDPHENLAKMMFDYAAL